MVAYNCLTEVSRYTNVSSLVNAGRVGLKCHINNPQSNALAELLAKGVAACELLERVAAVALQKQIYITQLRDYELYEPLRMQGRGPENIRTCAARTLQTIHDVQRGVAIDQEAVKVGMAFFADIAKQYQEAAWQALRG